MAPFSPLPPCSSPRSPRPIRLPSRPFSHIFGQIKPSPRRPPSTDILCGPESKGWVFGLFVACLIIVCWIATLPSSEPLLSRTSLKALGQELEDMRSALSNDLRAWNHLNRFTTSPKLVDEWDVSGIDSLMASNPVRRGRSVAFGKPASEASKGNNGSPDGSRQAGGGESDNGDEDKSLSKSQDGKSEAEGQEERRNPGVADPQTRGAGSEGGPKNGEPDAPVTVVRAEKDAEIVVAPPKRIRTRSRIRRSYEAVQARR